MEFPYQLVQACLYTCILYPMLFYNNSAICFFYYLCMTLLSLMLYVAFGMVRNYGPGTEIGSSREITLCSR